MFQKVNELILKEYKSVLNELDLKKKDIDPDKLLSELENILNDKNLHENTTIADYIPEQSCFKERIDYKYIEGLIDNSSFPNLNTSEIWGRFSQLGIITNMDLLKQIPINIKYKNDSDHYKSVLGQIFGQKSKYVNIITLYLLNGVLKNFNSKDQKQENSSDSILDNNYHNLKIINEKINYFNIADICNKNNYNKSEKSIRNKLNSKGIKTNFDLLSKIPLYNQNGILFKTFIEDSIGDNIVSRNSIISYVLTDYIIGYVMDQKKLEKSGFNDYKLY